MTFILQAPINKLGYGYTGYNFAKNCDCKVFPIGHIQSEDDSYFNRKELMPSIGDSKKPTVKIYHQHSLFDRVGSGRYFGFPIFELDTFSSLEKASLSFTDELIVCSEWAKEVCIKNGVTQQISVVNLGYDPHIFFSSKKERDNGRYVFLNMGKWETRKGHDVLIKAFSNAFSHRDEVELWMVPENPFLTREEVLYWESLYEKSKLWAKIKILGRQQSHIDLARIIRQSDCGVFPTRAEGWNMGGLECLVSGKELIITDYSGHTEYANKDNSHLINITEMEQAQGCCATEQRWFFGQGNWGKISHNEIDQLVELMRHCYKNKPNKNVGHDYSRFIWKNVAEDLEKVVNQ